MEPGQSWRRQCWRKARADLLPNALPIEVIRGRVRRASELGLDYRTYAGIRASTGHDIVAILFSTNALHLVKGRSAEAARLAKLNELIACQRKGLAVRPLSVEMVRKVVPEFDAVHHAPDAFATWSVQQAAMRWACQKLPADRVLLVGETAPESEWSQAGRLAGFLSGERYFAL